MICYEKHKLDGFGWIFFIRKYKFYTFNPVHSFIEKLDTYLLLAIFALDITFCMVCTHK